MDRIAEPFREEREVIVPDLQGHGPGPHSCDIADYTVDAMADAVDALVTAPFHLVGYSMGGRVALAAACSHPDRIRSLSLIGASAGLVSEEERIRRAESDDALADRILHEGLEAFVDDWMANPLFATQARLGTDFLVGSRAQRLTNEPVALARSLQAASTGRMRPLHAELSRCEMPVALIVGDEDPKFAAIAATMAETMPNATVHTIADAGHATHIEQPGATVAAIRSTIEAAE